ncbi:zinc-responsive transcriptional regulator Zap1p [Monosporozyma servazzii]
MYDSTSLESKKNGNGVVHGHIHNYNNLTYIHGHVHHNALETDLSDFNGDAQSQAESLQQNTTTINSNYNTNLSHSDCKPFEFFDFHNNDNVTPFSTIQLDQIPSYNNNTQSKRKFEELDDNILSQMASNSKKITTRKNSNTISDNNATSIITDDDCTPKVFEICCDINHGRPVSQNKEEYKIDSLPSISINNATNPNKNDNIPFNNPNFLAQNLSTINTKKPTSNSLLSQNNMKYLTDLNCNFDCDFDCNTLNNNNNNNANTTLNDSKLISSSDSNSNNDESDFFDRYCQLCDNDEPHEQHVHDSENTPISSTSKTLSSTNSSKSVDSTVNNHFENTKLNQDMKILEDLCNISSLYEVPFAQHMSHHHQQQINGNNNNIEERMDGKGEGNSMGRKLTQNHSASNLLNPVIRSHLIENLQKSDSSRNNGNSNIHDHAPHHHHHKIELHTHVPMINNPTVLEVSKTKQTILNNAINFHVDTKMDPDDATNNLIPDIKSETIKSFNTVHSNNNLNELNTINFNWNFKRDEENDMKCLWNDCHSGTGYNNLIDLQKHMFVDHIPETKNTDFSCHWQDCFFEGNDVCSLVNHINDRHGINFGIKINEPYPDSQVTTNTAIVKEEEETGELQNMYKCQWDACTLKFNSLQLLNEHIETEHVPKRQHNYTCHWYNCDKIFSQRQKLLRHIKVHTGYKPYRCKTCNRTFANQETLIQHNRTHSGEKPYKCDICGKCFGGSSSLKIHIRTHTGEKPLKCPICDKRFNESSNLNKHLKTHTKKYCCDHCDKKFSTAKTLNTHVTSGGCLWKQNTQIPVGKQ